MVSFLKKCEVCQQFESSNLVPAGLLQPLPIPRQIWMSISIDFIIGLPRNQEKDTILVVVDRHSKYSHFAALAHPSTAKSIPKIYLTKFSYHTECQLRLVHVGVHCLNFRGWLLTISQHHPQTDGQTKVIKILEQYSHESL